LLFDPALLQDKNKGLVVEIFTKLLDNSVIPKQVNRIGFRIDVEKEIKAELNKASEQDCKKAVEIIRKVLSS
jgi:hypothetical protein